MDISSDNQSILPISHPEEIISSAEKGERKDSWWLFHDDLTETRILQVVDHPIVQDCGELQCRYMTIR